MEIKSSIAYLLRNEEKIKKVDLFEILISVLGTKKIEFDKAIQEMTDKKEISQDKKDFIKATAKLKRRITRTKKIKYSLPLWHRRWTVVIFQVPETNKKLRDQIRYQLKKHGFAVWENSLWISPHPLPQELASYLDNHNLHSQVKVFYGTLSSKDEQDLIESGWSFGQLAKQYEDFVKQSKRQFKRLKNIDMKNGLKEKSLDLLAKITEIKYLVICRQDPRLPRSFVSGSWIGFRANRIYNQLEKYLR